VLNIEVVRMPVLSVPVAMTSSPQKKSTRPKLVETSGSFSP
jgi:hypothetical protein